jgi:tRNA/rRNA methyltransferase
MVTSFFDYIEGELDAVGHFPEDKRPVMVRNLRDIFLRFGMAEQDVRTLRGVVRALASARRGRSGA